MRLTFYSALKPREDMLAKALADGARTFGDTLEIRWTGEYGEKLDGHDLKWPGPTPDTDVACCFGVKGRSKRILTDHRLVGKATLFFDKGYTRSKGEGGHTEYSRISVNGPDPTAYMMKIKRNVSRLAKLNLQVKDRVKKPYGHVLICASSEKYHDFHGLPPPHDYGTGLVSRLKKLCDRQIIYRPKPSSTSKQLGVIDNEYTEAELREALQHFNMVLIQSSGVGGASVSNSVQKMDDALRGCHCVVTHGSAAAMDAIIAGVPAVVLGGSIAKPVAELDLEKIEAPRWPNEEERGRWLSALAYCQWTTAELRSGEAWGELREEIARQKSGKS